MNLLLACRDACCNASLSPTSMCRAASFSVERSYALDSETQGVLLLEKPEGRKLGQAQSTRTAKFDPTSGSTSVPTSGPTKAPTRAPTRVPTRVSTNVHFPVSALRGLPTKTPRNVPRRCPQKCPRKCPRKRSVFTCPVFTCSVCYPKTDPNAYLSII